MAELFNDIKKAFNEVEKFNPHHDAMGRFSTGPNAVSFTRYTRDPKKQHWAELAMDRESVRQGVLGNDVRMVGTKVDESKKGHNVHRPKSQGGKKIGNAQVQRNRMRQADAKGEKFESTRERKNRLTREAKAKKKAAWADFNAQANKGNKRPKKAA